ncbi:MAG: hypothetical protein R3C59_07275 [Planctomycetaceae bacterium]
MDNIAADACPACLNRRTAEVDPELKARFVVGFLSSSTGQCNRCLFVGQPDRPTRGGSDTDEIPAIEKLNDPDSDG